jgi:hypothetical protein
MGEKLAWAFATFCAGLVLPAIAVFAHFAFSLSDWSALDGQIGKIAACIGTASIAVGLLSGAHHFSRAGLMSAASLCAGVLIALKTGFLLGGTAVWI